MKKTFPFLLVFALTFVLKTANATNYTWTGAGANTNWSNNANWGGSGHPVAGDQATIPNTANQPTVDVASACSTLIISGTATITLSSTLAVGTMTINKGLTFAGTSTVTLSGATTFSNNMPLTINSGASITYGSGSSLALGQSTVFTNGGTCTFNSATGITFPGNSSSIVNNGTMNITSTPITIGFQSGFTNNGTCKMTSLTFTCSQNNFTLLNTKTMTLTTVTVNMSGQTDLITNTGSSAYITLDGTTINYTGGNPGNYISNGVGATIATANNASTLNMGSYSNYIINAGTFYAGASGVACNINLTTQASHIVNTGNFILTSSTLALSGYQSSCRNYGGFTAYGGSTINIGSTTLSSTQDSLSNYGTFYAGQSGSLCTINLNNSGPALSNAKTTVGATTYTGYFDLGPASVLSINSAASSPTVTNSASTTFILDSDNTGSATISAISQTTPPFTGTYNVNRFITGGSTQTNPPKWDYRNYRFLSSPVNIGKDGNNNYPCSLNYLAASVIVTDCTSSFGTTPGNPSLYLYNEGPTPSNAGFTTGNFIGVTNISNTATTGYLTTTDGTSKPNVYVGVGYMMYFRGDKTNFTSKTTYPYVAPENVTLTATGNLNQGTYNVVYWNAHTAGLLYSGSGTGGNYMSRGLNLIGNPYPSSIDWNNYSSTSSSASIYAPNTYSTIYILNIKTSQYDKYNPTTGMGTGIATNIIPSGQGFFIQASAASPTITFKESAKTNTQVGTGNLFMGNPNQQTAYKSYMRLKLVKDSLNNDDIVIGFNASSTTNYNPIEDSEVFPNGPETLASITADNVQTAMKWLPLPKGKGNTKQVIKLNVTATASGVYKFTRPALTSVPSIYEIWLMDSFQKDSLDLRNNATYTFNMDLTDTNSYGSKRFQVVVRQNPTLGVHLLNFTAVKTSGGAQVNWKTENEQNYTYFTVERSTDSGVTYNVLGGFSSTAIGTYGLLDKDPFPIGATSATDKYRLKIEDLNGNITYSQVITLNYSSSNKDAAFSNISVYPNPVGSVLNVTINPSTVSYTSNSSALQMQSITPGLTSTNVSTTYSIKIINVTGTVVKTGTCTSETWQANVGNLSPGTYIIQVTNTDTNTLVGKGTFIKL